MIRVVSTCSDKDYSFDDKLELSFYGEVLDDRTEYSTAFTRSNSVKSLKVKYNAHDLNLNVDEEVVECHDFVDRLSKMIQCSIMIDSTSLDIPELALIFKGLLSREDVNIDILYVEPAEYSQERSTSPENESYNLSDEIVGFEGAGIPMITTPVSDGMDKKFIFFAGFEESRIANAFETFDVRSDEAQIVFGMPAFNLGWELVSFKKNIKVLKENDLQGRIGFCSASCASSALDYLRSVRCDDSAVHLLPLGTKPNTVGVMLYLSENENAKLLYDQPRKKKGRSVGVGQKHLYRVTKP